MPKAIKISPQDDIATLWDAYKKTTCSTTKRRLQAIALLAEGRSREEVTAVTRYHNNSIKNIILRYNDGGIAALRNMQRENPGRPSRISKKQREEISQKIVLEIAEKNFWDGNKLVNYIKQEYGIKISLSSAYRLFHELGYSIQIPRPSHIKGDKDLQKDFKGKS